MQTNEPTQNKYDEALSKYPTRLDDAAIAAEVAALIDRKPETRRIQHAGCEEIPLPLHRPHHPAQRGQR